MGSSVNRIKGLVSLAERTQGFLQDGYQIMFEHKDESLCMVKLKHQNGNVITLSYNIVNGTITQRTNGRETHQEKVC